MLNMSHKQILKKMRIWSHLLEKSLMENLPFFAVKASVCSTSFAYFAL